MMLELTIQGKKMSKAEVEQGSFASYEQRKQIVNSYSAGMKEIYSNELMSTEDWEIVLVCQSKMNPF